MAIRVTGRAEDHNGANTHYRVSSESIGFESIVTRQLGVEMQKVGLLPDYHVMTVNEVEYLRDNPDTRIEDNIDNQPLLEITKTNQPKFKMTVEE